MSCVASVRPPMHDPPNAALPQLVKCGGQIRGRGHHEWRNPRAAGELAGHQRGALLDGLEHLPECLAR